MVQETENFGDWLKHWRNEKGLTQEEVGSAIGVSKQHISNLERGQIHYQSGSQARASIEVIDKLAKLFGRPISEAREAAGYGIGEATGLAPTKNDDISKLPEQLAELNRVFLSLPPDQRKNMLAIAETLYKMHVNESGVEIVDDVDLSKSDAREIKPGKDS